MTLYLLSISGVFIIIASYLFVAGIRAWADRKKILDIPNERSSHHKPIPRGGGIAIVVITMGALWIVYIMYPSVYEIKNIITFTMAGIIVAGISLLDDLSSIRNTVRFLVHGFVAIAIIWNIGFISEISIPIIGEIKLQFAGIIITFLFIVGLTNAYNFMDGIDGIAAVQAIIAGLGWAIIGYFYSHSLILLLGFVVTVSSIGFLIHNWHPARIFMGDVGSAFLGFTFATITIIGVQKDPILVYPGILLVWPFIFDTVYTLIRRMVYRENIFEAHRSHLYQRLVIAGWGHRSVTILYGILASVAWIPIGFMVWKIQVGYILTFLIPILLFLLLLVITFRYEKRYSRYSSC